LYYYLITLLLYYFLRIVFANSASQTIILSIISSDIGEKKLKSAFFHPLSALLHCQKGLHTQIHTNFLWFTHKPFKLQKSNKEH